MYIQVVFKKIYAHQMPENIGYFKYEMIFKSIVLFICYHQLVSRDGSNIYKNAISTAHKDALQISDRFHLLKNLTDKAKQELEKILPYKLKILLNSHNIEEKTTKIRPFTEKELARIELIKQVNERYLKCKNISKLSFEFNLDRRVVKKYVSGYKLKPRTQKTSRLSNYNDLVDDYISKGSQIVTIQSVLKDIGVNVSYSNLRQYIEKRKKIKNKNIFITIFRSDLIRLLYNKGISDVKPLNENKSITIKLLNDYKKALEVINLVTSFRILLYAKSKDKLDEWIFKIKKLNYKYLHKFAETIERDYEAVLNSIYLNESNGLVEGKINKLKVIKRVMYGRCSFETLKNKFFLAQIQPD